MLMHGLQKPDVWNSLVSLQSSTAHREDDLIRLSLQATQIRTFEPWHRSVCHQDGMDPSHLKSVCKWCSYKVKRSRKLFLCLVDKTSVVLVIVVMTSREEMRRESSW